jgi:transposase InsO family protein
MDLYNGEIVAYESSHLPNFSMVMSMLEKAVKTRGSAAKAEYFHLTDFEDVDALRAGLKGYIDYYNRHRIGSKLCGLSPVAYRMRAGKN